MEGAVLTSNGGGVVYEGRGLTGWEGPHWSMAVNGRGLREGAGRGRSLRRAEPLVGALYEGVGPNGRGGA